MKQNSLTGILKDIMQTKTKPLVTDWLAEWLTDKLVHRGGLME